MTPEGITTPVETTAATMTERSSAIDFRALFAPVADELTAVEEILHRELRSQQPFVDKLLQHGVRLGGKRLRPALLLLSGQAAGELSDDHQTLAAVLEMIHTATLIHDDVLDEADLRRHEETVNARHGNETSVLLGDYLFSHAFYLASTLGSTDACQQIGRSTNTVCRGEMMQINSRGNYDLDEAEYFEIIDAKTAELCACCCLLGARHAGADSQRQGRYERYGRNLGIAFQIVDDLLDLLGQEKQTGKSLGTDLEKEKLTLPIIRLLAEADDVTRLELESLLSLHGDERHPALMTHLLASGALDYARQQAAHYAQAARDELSDAGEGPAHELLMVLPDFVLSRLS